MDKHVFLIAHASRHFRIALAPEGTPPRLTWRATVAELVAEPGSGAIAEHGRFEARTPDLALAQAAAAVARRVLGGPVRRLPVSPPAPAPEPPADEHHATATVSVADTPAPWEIVPPPAAIAAPPVDLAALPSRDERADALAAVVDAAVERLAGQLADGHTAEFREVLAFFARFRTYSPLNCLAVRAQCPHATRVAGVKTWNSLGYTVKKGEKAIWITAPTIKKEADATTGQEAEVVVGFRLVPVFDASQLAGIAERPLPAPDRPLPDDAEDLYQAVVARIVATGITVEERHLPAGVEGVSRGGSILVRPGLDSRSRLFVLLHELAHELAHQGPDQREKPRQQRELEAESTAFVAAAALGLESPGSRDYLLSHLATPAELRASLGTIQRLARRVLAVVAPVEPVEEEMPIAA